MTWLKKLGRSKELSSAFEDLRRLATGHHQAVSAVTLYTAQQTMGMLTKSVACEWARGFTYHCAVADHGAGDEQELDVTRKCLAEIAETARNTYGTLVESADRARLNDSQTSFVESPIRPETRLPQTGRSSTTSRVLFLTWSPTRQEPAVSSRNLRREAILTRTARRGFRHRQDLRLAAVPRLFRQDERPTLRSCELDWTLAH